MFEIQAGRALSSGLHDAGEIGKCGDNRSQERRFFALVNDEGHKIAAQIHWESKDIHRVCRLSAAAECLSSVEAFDTMMWLANMTKELAGDSLEGRKCLLTDDDGLVRKAVNTALPLEKRLRTDMAIPRQGLHVGEYKMKWVRAGAMLADPLSKGDICVSNNVRERVTRSLSRAFRTDCSFNRGVSTRKGTSQDFLRY